MTWDLDPVYYMGYRSCVLHGIWVLYITWDMDSVYMGSGSLYYTVSGSCILYDICIPYVTWDIDPTGPTYYI